jgi:uncharacterized Ntn-hydrolase superfamily protein
MEIFDLMKVGTYSITAIDAEAGEMGIGVQSHWFSVGSVVPWAEPSGGVVATQSFVETMYGFLGTRMMKSGMSARDTLSALLHVDKKREVRQVAMIDSRGGIAVHTGKRCLPECGHLVGKSFSVQANLMSTKKVWQNMAKEFEKSGGSLSDRIMAALEAAEKAGGDVRGKQSCAILVVKVNSSDKPWNDRIVDLRVEDEDEPLVEMRRLLRIRESYKHADAADSYAASGKIEEAVREYTRAFELAPEKEELRYWFAIGMINSGNVDEGIKEIKKVYAKNPRLAKLTRVLPKYGLLRASKEVIKEIV